MGGNLRVHLDKETGDRPEAGWSGKTRLCGSPAAFVSVDHPLAAFQLVQSRFHGLRVGFQGLGDLFSSHAALFSEQ